jgi:hypothetical protein
MNIWENLAANAYENKDPYPVQPRKPRLKDAASPAEHREYADLLEAYELKLAEFRLQQTAYHARCSELHAQFQIDLEAYYEMTGHAKAPLLYSKAYERGHSSGLHEVACVYDDLVELVK